MNNKTDNGIHRFDGHFAPLSNFYNNDILVYFDGLFYKNSEAAYQSAKTLDIKERKHFTSLNPYNAKNSGRVIKLRNDWDEVKDEIMYQIVKDKFKRNSYPKEVLISTYPLILEEGNTWNDKYWGVCNGKGENKLGKILMRVREELLNNK